MKAKAFKFGKMEANIKGIGRMIELMVTEDSFIPMVIAIMENGSTTKPMDAEHTNTWMALNTSATGKKINNMVTVSKPGQMKPNTKVTMNLERSMESELSNGLTSRLTLASFTIITYTVKVFTHG